MLDQSVGEPLLQQEAVPHKTRCHEIVLRCILLSLLISLGFAASVVLLTHSEAGQEPAINMASGLLQPARTQQFLQPARWPLANAWHYQSQSQRSPFHFAAQSMPWQIMRPERAVASVPAASSTLAAEMPPVHVVDELLEQKKDTPQPEQLRCFANSWGASGQVTPLTGMDEFLAAQRCSANRLIVYRFTSKFCRTCHAMGVKFKRLAKEFPEARFFDVPMLDANRKVFEDSNVKTVPFVEMYQGSKGKLEQGFICTTPSEISLLKEKLVNSTLATGIASTAPLQPVR